MSEHRKIWALKAILDLHNNIDCFFIKSCEKEEKQKIICLLSGHDEYDFHDINDIFPQANYHQVWHGQEYEEKMYKIPVSHSWVGNLRIVEGTHEPTIIDVEWDEILDFFCG